MDDETRKQEASRLSAKLSEINVSKFAREFNVPGGGSMVYQHATGRRAISLKAGLAYAKGLGCPLEEISPRLALLAQNVRNSTENVQLHSRMLTEREHQVLDLFAGLTARQQAEEIRRLVEAKERNDELRKELAKEFL